MNHKSVNSLRKIKERCFTIFNFMILKYGNKNNFKRFIDVVNETYAKKNLSGMRYIERDLNEWIKGFSNADISELDELLKNKFGTGLDIIEKKNQKIIQKVIKRGKILNEKEYRLIKNREDEIYVDNSKAEEKQQLDRLMEAYEESTSANNV